MEKEIQKTKRQEEHFVRTYAHLHRFLPDKGYYVTVDNYSDPSARTHIAINWTIDHLSDPQPCPKREYMKSFRSAIDKMSGVPEDDSFRAEFISPSESLVTVIRHGVEIKFRARYITQGHFEITIGSVESDTGDSIYGFLESMGLLDFLVSELVNVCRENIYVDRDAIEEDESMAAKDHLDMIRDSYLL